MSTWQSLQTIRRRLRWLLAATLLLLAVGAFARALWWPAVALVLAVSWVRLATRRPLAALLTTMAVYALVYNRFSLQAVQVSGPGERGMVALADLLWLGMMGAWLVAAVRQRRPLPRLALPGLSWLLAPFLGLIILLPMLAVMLRSEPPTDLAPGLRQLAWATMGVAAFVLARRHGPVRMLRAVMLTVLGVTLAHTLYAAVQLGFSLGILGLRWIQLDVIYASNHFSWFSYPRLTGLMVNPNVFGIFGAFALVLAAALLVAGSRPRRVSWALLLCSVFILVFSSSRSAAVGAACGLVALAPCCLVSRSMMTRGLIYGVSTASLAVALVAALWPVVPPVTQERFANLLRIYSEGAAIDANSAARVANWHDIIDTCMATYPLGTWVPTTYAVNMTTDSYYVETLLQGTPIFTLAWLLFMGGAAAIGWHGLRGAGDPLTRGAGLALVGWMAVMATVNFTAAAMVEAPLVVPLWVLLGTVAATLPGRPVRGQYAGG